MYIVQFALFLCLNSCGLLPVTRNAYTNRVIGFMTGQLFASLGIVVHIFLFPCSGGRGNLDPLWNAYTSWLVSEVIINWLPATFLECLGQGDKPIK